MSRLAELHDGEVLEFPDETPDAVMDGTVRKHLAGKYPAKAAGVFTQGEPIPDEEQMVGPQVADVAGAVDMLAQTVASIQDGQRAVTEAIAAAAGEIKALSGAHARVVPAINQAAGEFAGVREQLASLGKKIEAAASMERRLVFDSKGEPVGFKPVSADDDNHT